MMMILPKYRRVIVAITFLTLLLACGEEKRQRKAPVRRVKSATVIGGDSVYRHSFSGRLHSTSEVSFSFKVGGTLKSLPVKKGDRVGKGDTLATLEASDYELQVGKAKASLAQTRADYRNAKANYSRVKRLYEAGNTARNELDDARAESDTAAARVEADRKSLEIAQRELSYTVLKSDADCAVASVDPDVGENISSGQRVVYATCGDELEVKLNIPESVISYIQKDMPVKVSFSAFEGRKFEGKVSEVGVSSVGSGTTFPVNVLITGSDKQQLKAGLSAEVEFNIDSSKGSKSNTIVVPPFAVGEDEVGRFAYVLEAQEGGFAMVRRTPIEVGEIRQNGIEISSGLTPGMRIVTAGVSVLRDGMKVGVSDE